MTDCQPNSIKMYRTTGCPFCVMASELLTQLGFEFEEIILDSHPDRRGLTSSIRPGHQTVPLVVVGDTPVGGFDDLRALHTAGQLEATLRPN